ncbi:MAG: hypothetical protein HKN50_10445 [Gammaproteobacteria bacterium]|nr:hypothetical protein [Gammaproteobacteria bacterium]
MSGRLVIVAFKPNEGMEDRLERLVLKHVPLLRELELVTEREPVIMRCEDGTVVEVFEWASPQAVEKAHENAAVRSLWDQYAELCEYIPIGHVKQCREMFADFTPLN